MVVSKVLLDLTLVETLDGILVDYQLVVTHVDLQELHLTVSAYGVPLILAA